MKKLTATAVAFALASALTVGPAQAITTTVNPETKECAIYLTADEAQSFSNAVAPSAAAFKAALRAAVSDPAEFDSAFDGLINFYSLTPANQEELIDQGLMGDAGLEYFDYYITSQGNLTDYGKETALELSYIVAAMETHPLDSFKTYPDLIQTMITEMDQVRTAKSNDIFVDGKDPHGLLPAAKKFAVDYSTATKSVGANCLQGTSGESEFTTSKDQATGSSMGAVGIGIAAVAGVLGLIVTALPTIKSFLPAQLQAMLP